MYSMHAKISSWGGVRETQWSVAANHTSSEEGGGGGGESNGEKKQIKGLGIFFHLTGRLKGYWFVSQHPQGLSFFNDHLLTVFACVCMLD